MGRFCHLDREEKFLRKKKVVNTKDKSPERPQGLFLLPCGSAEAEILYHMRTAFVKTFFKNFLKYFCFLK